MRRVPVVIFFIVTGIAAGVLIASLSLSFAQTIPTLSAWYFNTSSTITTRTTSTSVQVPALGASGNPCVSIANASGTLATTTCGSGGSGAFNATGSPSQIMVFTATSTGLGYTNLLYNSSTNLFSITGIASSSELRTSSATVPTLYGNVNFVGDTLTINSQNGIGKLRYYWNGGGVETGNIQAAAGGGVTLNLTNNQQFTVQGGGISQTNPQPNSLASTTINGQATTTNLSTTGLTFTNATGTNLNVSSSLLIGNAATSSATCGQLFTNAFSYNQSQLCNQIIDSTGPSITYYDLFNGRASLNPPATTSYIFSGLDLFTRIPNGNNTNFQGAAYGASELFEHRGGGTLGTSVGGSYESSNFATGTITANYGAAYVTQNRGPGSIGTNEVVDLYNNITSGTVGTNYGLKLTQLRSGGNVTSSYGIYLNDQTPISSSSWAIYSLGGNNYFGGNVGIGTANPSTTLHVVGSTTITGQATTTNLSVTSLSNALVTTNANGAFSNYGGASACAAGNAVTTISASGGTTCSAFLTSNAITSSSAITAGYYPFWGNATGGLQGTSSIQAVGGGANTSTAILGNLSIGTSTTSSVPLFMPLSNAPTNATSGQLWNDNVQQAFTTGNGGIPQTFNRTMFTQTNTVSSVNTTSTVSLIGTGVGTTTIPANFLVPGRTLRIVNRGIINNTAATSTVLAAIKLGNSLLASSTNAFSSFLGTDNYELAYDLTTRATGTTGSVMGLGRVFYGFSFVNPLSPFNVGVTTTVNTTIPNKIDILFAFTDVATSTNSVSSTITTFEILN